MAYRKTEKVLAHMEARSNSIIAAGIDLIAKHGIEGLTTGNVAERAEVSEGLIYKYYPNMAELFAAIVEHCRSRDAKAIAQAATLPDALTVYYSRLKQPRLVKVLADAPAYREAIEGELQAKIMEMDHGQPPKEARITAAASLGALLGVYGSCDGSKKSASRAVLFVLSGLDFVSEHSF